MGKAVLLVELGDAPVQAQSVSGPQAGGEAHLESLADTSDKMIRGIDESDESEKADETAAAVPEQAAEPALAEASVAPPAGDSSPSGSFSGGGSELS